MLTPLRSVSELATHSRHAVGAFILAPYIDLIAR